MQRIFLILLLATIAFSCTSTSEKVINIEWAKGDMTPIVRKIIESNSDNEIKLVFETGTYLFKPDYAFQKYCYVTNHNNGLKNIVFPFQGLKSVTIEGNGAEFIFHGRVMPFLFEGCQNVSVQDLSVDWDIPFTFQGEVVGFNQDEEWLDIEPFNQGFSWKLKNGEITFPNIDGFKFSKMGSTLEFEPEEKKVAHGAFDYYTKPTRVEKRENKVLRLHGKIRQYPKVGNVLHYKGPMDENRYAPAFQVISSKDIVFDNVSIHHALGMGFLAERSENVTLLNSGVFVKDGSDRVVSIIADATHFCNCKGDILIENCRFENMLDDGTNVHGTYVEVDEIIDSKTLRYELKHFQQMGFEFAGVGDEMWLIQQPSMQRGGVNVVESIKIVNDRYTEITFKNDLPKDLKQGDLLENKTWNPTFTMRGCTIQNHRARNIVLKTPLKTVIEDNFFSSMMSSVFFRGESFFWFESGAVEDVLIQNNRFKHCAYSGSQHAVLYITPRLGKAFTKNEQFDRNIRFINNKIETFDSRIVWAQKVDGLEIKDNEIVKTDSYPALFPDAPVFDLKDCKNISITGNKYRGEPNKFFDLDEISETSLELENNVGF